MPQICTKSGPVVFIVSGRENSPAPTLTGTMSTAAWTAIEQGSPIGLVDLDGEPRLTMAGARADYPHADVLNALSRIGVPIREGRDLIRIEQNHWSVNRGDLAGLAVIQ